jgi:hypothetical protein
MVTSKEWKPFDGKRNYQSGGGIMVIAGINVIDTDSLEAAADIVEEVETWITCPECDGARPITDYSPSHGYINIECPCGQANGMIVECDDDPEPPTPAAPIALPVPPVRLPLWASMAAAANGRLGADSRQSRDDRRRHRRELDRAS